VSSRSPGKTAARHTSRTMPIHNDPVLTPSPPAEGHRSPTAGPAVLRRRRDRGLEPVSADKWDALFEFRTVAANISELFRPLEKPPLAALPLFVGC